MKAKVIGGSAHIQSEYYELVLYGLPSLGKIEIASIGEGKYCDPGTVLEIQGNRANFRTRGLVMSEID